MKHTNRYGLDDPEVIGKSGFIVVFRDRLDWSFSTDPLTCHLYNRLELTANFENSTWHGIDIKRGQVLTSLDHMAKKTGLSIQNVKTCLKKLVDADEIYLHTTSRYTIVTLIHYDEDQYKEEYIDASVQNQFEQKHKEYHKPDEIQMKYRREVKPQNKEKRVMRGGKNKINQDSHILNPDIPNSLILNSNLDSDFKKKS